MPVLCCVYNVQELLSSLDDVADDKFGRKVLLYLLRRRDTLHFHPSIVSILSRGDSNKHRLTTASLSSLSHHHLTRKINSEMTYNVLSGMLHPTVIHSNSNVVEMQQFSHIRIQVGCTETIFGGIRIWFCIKK